MPKSEQTIQHPLDENEFEFPIGYTDKEGKFHKTFKLKEMTGEVDEKIADDKVRKNGGKLITELIDGVLESIGDMSRFNKDDIRRLSSVDRDFIILKNFEYSIGETITYDEKCGNCGEENEVNLYADNVPVEYLEQNESKLTTLELPRGVKDKEGNVYNKITLGFLDGFAQEKMGGQKVNGAQMTTHMLASITESIDGYDDWDYNTFKKMSKRDRKFIMDELSKVKIGADMFPKVTCINCDTEFTAPIPIYVLLGE